MVAAQHHKEVADHGSLALLIQLHHAAFGKTLQCHFHHAYRTLYDHLAGINDGGRLLALQHDGCDLGGVGKVGDAGLDDLDASLRYPLLDLTANTGGDQLAGAAQTAVIGDAVAGGIYIGGDIVRIQPNDIAQGAIALQGKEFLVVIDIKDRLGGIYNAPCDGNADFYGVAP